MLADGGYDGDDICTPSDASTAGCECASGLEETFVDFNVDGLYTGENGLYSGALCPEEAAADGDCTRELVNVRKDTVLVMSNADDQRIVMIDDAGGGGADNVITSIPDSNASETRLVLIADRYNNLPPAGSTINVEADACQLISNEAFTVPNTSFVGPYAFYVTIAREPTNATLVRGFITIRLTPTNGAEQVLEIECNDPV